MIYLILKKNALKMEAFRDVEEFAAKIIQMASCQKEHESTSEEELEM